MTGVAAIIVAAGEGRRFGSAKQFALLRGRPVLDWSLAAFHAHPLIREIVLVLPDETLGRSYTGSYPKIAAVVRGGALRQDSVYAGLSRLDARRTEIVLVHDGARPFVADALIRRVVREAAASGAAVPGVPVEDTVKETEGGRVVRTLDRSKLSRVQTPQGFVYDVLKRALDRARAEGVSGTDDAALVERLGERVSLVDGDPDNIKITTRRDLEWAEAFSDAANRPRI